MRKALEFLKRPQIIEGRIRAVLYKIELCKSMAERITASLGNAQVSRTRDVTANENAIIRLAEAREKLEKLQTEYHDVVDEITKVVGSMDDQEQQIILLDYYLGHRAFEDIASRLQVSRTHVYDQHKAGLDELETLLAS